MASLPEPVASLIQAFSKLPGIGPRSAERIALHLVQADKAISALLAETLLDAREKISLCQTCGALTERQPCEICSDPRRDRAIICVIERPVDIFSLEKSGGYKGLYHVLGGKISPINGIGPEDLRVHELAQRVRSGAIREIIIALPSDVEGDATSFYLNNLLRDPAITISRIAHGLPVGSGLEFADELTLSRALEGRRQIT